MIKGSRQREKEGERETRTSRLAHGGLIRSSLLTLLPAARLLCADVEREQRRPLRSPNGTSSPTKRTEPASIPHYVAPNSHPLILPLFVHRTPATILFTIASEVPPRRSHALVTRAKHD